MEDKQILMSRLNERLIEQLHQGNRLIFRQIFDEYYSGLRSFAYKYIEDDTITEDFVQEAFLSLWENKKEFNNKASIKSYLFTLVRNNCLNHLRHQKVRYKNSEELKNLSLEQTFKDLYLEEEVHTMVYDAIKDLSTKARRVVIMSMNGVSNPEIAEELNVSVNTVKTTKLRAYKILRNRLKGVSWVVLSIFFS